MAHWAGWYGAFHLVTTTSAPAYISGKTAYAEFIEHGEEAYVRSHFGDARADMLRSTESMMASVGETLFGMLEQNGNMGVMLDRLRTMGMGDLADRIAASRG